MPDQQNYHERTGCYLLAGCHPDSGDARFICQHRQHDRDAQKECTDYKAGVGTPGVPSDTWNHRVQKFDANGAFLLEWREQTSGFWGPRGIAVTRDGKTVYVTDTGNKRVVAFTAEGQQLSTWGGDGSKPGEFIEPVGIVVDDTGRVIVADTGNHRVQYFDAQGKFLKEHVILGWEEFYTEPHLAMLGADLLTTDSYAARCTRYWFARSRR